MFTAFIQIPEPINDNKSKVIRVLISAYASKKRREAFISEKIGETSISDFIRRQLNIRKKP